jgi:hypothetical protein
MKNIFLAGGILAILFNSIAGIVISDYSITNWLLADISLLVSTGIVFSLYSHFLDNAFKAVFTFLFLISGLIRYILCFFVASTLEDNWMALTVTALFFIEILFFVFGLVLKKK